MGDQKILVGEAEVQIRELSVPLKHVADFLRTIPQDEVPQTVVKAIEIGTFCLERGRTSQDLEFVRRQVGELLNTVDSAVKDIPPKVEQALVGRMGVGDGQVLAPIKKVVDEVSAVLTSRISDVKTLLSQDLNPADAKSVLGGALQQIREMLDPKQTDSVQRSLDSAVRNVTGQEGLLAIVVKATVDTALMPLREEVDRLAKEVRGKSAAEEALQQTTLKGAPYEQEVASILQKWAQTTGAEVFHVGGDNEPGDVILKFRGDGLIPQPLSIVVEARDRTSRQFGRKAITDEMNIKLAQRDGNAGIYLSRTDDGLSKTEIGEWAEGVCGIGHWVACTHQHLITAVRFLVVQQRLSALRKATPQVDSASIEEQVKLVRISLARVKTIKTRLTELNECSDAIEIEVEQLRDEIKIALLAIEDSLRTAGAKIAPVAAAHGEPFLAS